MFDLSCWSNSYIIWYIYNCIFLILVDPVSHLIYIYKRKQQHIIAVENTTIILYGLPLDNNNLIYIMLLLSLLKPSEVHIIYYIHCMYLHEDDLNMICVFFVRISFAVVLFLSFMCNHILKSYTKTIKNILFLTFYVFIYTNQRFQK